MTRYDPAQDVYVCESCGTTWEALAQPCPSCHPLEGHAGDCAKVCHATITGATDTDCTCRKPSAQGDGAGV